MNGTISAWISRFLGDSWSAFCGRKGLPRVDLCGGKRTEAQRLPEWFAWFISRIRRLQTKTCPWNREHAKPSAHAKGSQCTSTRNKRFSLCQADLGSGEIRHQLLLRHGSQHRQGLASELLPVVSCACLVVLCISALLFVLFAVFFFQLLGANVARFYFKRQVNRAQVY